MNTQIKSHYYGEKISDYGLKNGFVDYRTFANALGDMVLNNELIEHEEDWEVLTGELEQEVYYDGKGNEYSESEYNELAEEEKEKCYCDYQPNEVYQWFIISGTDWQIKILAEADEICVYLPKFDITLWGVQHWGTSWDCVLTGIPCEKVDG